MKHKSNIKCDLEVTYSSVSPEQSVKIFEEAFEKTSRMSYYTKNLPYLNSVYQQNIDRNIQSRQLDEVGLEADDFYVTVSGNQMLFKNKTPRNMATHYEYGSSYDGEVITPYYYITPAVKDVSKKFSNIIASEAIQYYNRRAKGESIPTAKSNKTKQSPYDIRKY